MNTEKDGGQAFAQYRTDPWGNPVIENGMTLRDYFAAKAMQALIAKYDGEDHCLQNIPEDSFDYADAMLAERAK